MPVKVEPQIPPVVQPAVETTGDPKGFLLIADDDGARAASTRDDLIRQGFDCDFVKVPGDVGRAFAVRDYDLIILCFRDTAQCAAGARAVRDVEKNFHGQRVPVVAFASGMSCETMAAAGIDHTASGVFNPLSAAALMAKHAGTAPAKTRPLSPREPVNYRALLRVSGRDDERAQAAVAEFEKNLRADIVRIGATLDANDVAEFHKAVTQLRGHARQVSSLRVQSTAAFLSVLPAPGPMKSFVPGALAELEAAARDLAVWRALALGQSVPGMKRRTAASKTTTSRVTKFVKQREDVFARFRQP